ncbi:unnamed protein product, partial [Vitis vinifera]
MILIDLIFDNNTAFTKTCIFFFSMLTFELSTCMSLCFSISICHIQLAALG